MPRMFKQTKMIIYNLLYFIPIFEIPKDGHWTQQLWRVVVLVTWVNQVLWPNYSGRISGRALHFAQNLFRDDRCRALAAQSIHCSSLFTAFCFANNYIFLRTFPGYLFSADVLCFFFLFFHLLSLVCVAGGTLAAAEHCCRACRAPLSFVTLARKHAVNWWCRL